jgi:hypothetical protein
MNRLPESGSVIRNNTVINNESLGVLVVSYKLMEVLIPGATDDPATNPYPDHIFIHDNVFMSNGTTPQSPFTMIGVTPLEDVLWDGIDMSGMPTDPTVKFCLGTKSPWPSFRMFDGTNIAVPSMAMQSKDPAPYECDLPMIKGNPP